MSTNGLVSVLIPTHFRNGDLAVAVQSALDQTYDPVEVIVIDDSGEEHAKEVVAGYDTVEYLPMTESQGPQAARIAGFEASNGEYVQFLDDDDSLRPEKLERQVPLFDAKAGVGVVYCGIQWEGGPAVYPKPGVRGNVLAEALRFDTAPCMMGTMLLTRSVCEQIPLDKHTHGADDIGLKIELARATDFDYVDEILVTRGDSPDSVSTSWAAVDGRFEIIEMYEELYHEFPARVRREALAEAHLIKGERYLYDKRWSWDAIKSFWRAMAYAPGVDPVYLGALGLSLFGRPGHSFGRSLYSRTVLGANRRGKTT